MKNERASFAPLECPLTDLQPGAVGRVIRIGPSCEACILAFGLCPGVKACLLQKQPCFVIGCEQAEIALDLSLAREVWVQVEQEGSQSTEG